MVHLKPFIDPAFRDPKDIATNRRADRSSMPKQLQDENWCVCGLGEHPKNFCNLLTLNLVYNFGSWIRTGKLAGSAVTEWPHDASRH